MSGPPRAIALNLVACHACDMVCRGSGEDEGRCPQCNAVLHSRRPNSLARAWACLLASIIFYVPANALPVMYTSLAGNGSESTILQGIIEFWAGGSYGIALVIFIASVAVPCTKFFIMGFLLTLARRRSTWAMRERAKLYRFVELVGYWSMLDVLVVAIVAALVKFQALSDVEPRVGILFFGLVVILTMLSAMSFDPRLTWDGEES